jgi:hypothetical protein
MIRNIKQFLFIAGLLLIAAGAQPVGAAIWSWSTTASTNATADPSINWSEGQAPSSINDSARAMMAVLAAWRNDISATNTTTGTATAYALATSEGVNPTPSNGQMISFIAHANSGAAPTLQVDGGNTYPLWLTGATIPAGTLVAGSPYRVAFSAANSAWLLEAGYGNTGTPLGGILWSTSPTAPSSNFVAPSGQCISTTTYATYWVQQGSPASGACPGGQFAIIDMRGRVAAALDTLNASAANRLTSASAGCGTAMTSIGATCANGLESRAISLAQLPTGITSPVTVTSNTANLVSANSGAVLFSYTPGGTLATAWPNGAVITVNSSVTAAGTATSNNTSGAATPFIPPTIGLIPYLRIL